MLVYNNIFGQIHSEVFYFNISCHYEMEKWPIEIDSATPLDQLALIQNVTHYSKCHGYFINVC